MKSFRYSWFLLKEEIQRRTTIRCHRHTFIAGGQTFMLEDKINLLLPWRSSRIMSIPGTGFYYSDIPLFPFSHRLLCYDYCVPALRANDKSFYERTLVLGCGGGTIPLWLLKEYPRATVDVVELYPEMIAICREYFLKRWEGSGRLTYHCTDARYYEAPAENYQFIFCDLFDKVDLAPVVTEADFALKLHTLLATNGMLVINCGWNHLADVCRTYGMLFENIDVLKREPFATQVVVARKT